MKTVTILGSTGSVGVNTLRVIKENTDLFKVDGLAAGTQSETLKQQVKEFNPKSVYIRDLKEPGQTLENFSSALDSDILVAASSGTSALFSVIQALERGRRVALANKEILVMAGRLVMQALRGNPESSLIPVDSEHSAIFQCLQGSVTEDIEKIILTGSGGPLREISREKFGNLSKDEVINHPKWKMGKKISVDSATLMNKGLEIIEASWLFDLPIEKIEILIHPEAVIHSMVEFRDGAILAQLGVTDMRLPIQYALTFPKRADAPASLKLDFSKHSQLTFLEPDRKKFPCLELAFEAAKKSGSAPCVLSAADEVAVGAYLDDKIGFVEIPGIIEKVLSNHRHVETPELAEIQTIHNWAVEETKRLCRVV